MSLELGPLFASIVAYLTLLFLVAYAGDRGWLPERLIAHPLTYTLSLGVYATSWTYYGSVGFAQSQGYLFLTIYLGVTVAFALTPILLAPILRLTREYQLHSPADLFAFRYRSPAHFLEVFRTYYGPTHKAFLALDETAAASLAEDILRLIDTHNVAEDGSMVAPADYLEIVITR